MLARMQQAQIPWPRMEAKDIADLLEYLGQSPAVQRAQAKQTKQTKQAKQTKQTQQAKIP
jgi:hypothetical protein